MKKTALIFFAGLIFSCSSNQHSEQSTEAAETDISLPGFYTGEIVCESCDSKFIELELFEDSTFLLMESYTASSEIPSVLKAGYWNSESLVTPAESYLLSIDKNNVFLKSEDNTGFAAMIKTDGKISTTNTFKARGYFFYWADASTFTLCGGKRYPVAYTEEHYQAELLFLEKNTDELILDLIITIETIPNQDGIVREQVLIHRVIGKAGNC
jgi:hypothetical protein